MNVAERFKISAFARGIRISREAEQQLTQGGHIPLTVHEYPTTGGVTLVLDDDVYVNAPFNNPCIENPEASLLFDASCDTFVVAFRGKEMPAEVIRLPGYLYAKDSQGRPVTATVFSHADRVRVSPIYGCTMSCKFCDIAGHRYARRPLKQLLEALSIAKADPILPVYHILISGGTPGPLDYEYFDDVCAGIIESTEMRVDVMMPPRPQDPEFIDRLVDIGVYGFAINIEIFDDDAAKRIIPQKHQIGLDLYAETIERAVQLTGDNGRVRSLVLVGLEPEEKTLEGVEFLASLGCDPTLSPFRPTPGIPLADYPPPSYELLKRVYIESANIAEKYRVKLGPRCVPCQHNTLTFPDDSGAYYYSAEVI